MGEEEVRNRMPADDLPLLANILRTERRKENAKNRQVALRVGSTAQEEESTGRKSARTRYIREGEDPLDLLNVEDVTRGVSSRKFEEESESEMEMDENGRFIVREEEKEDHSKKRVAPSEEVEEEEKKEEKRIGAIRRNGKRNVNEDGARFRSTKAKGDMKKGNVDPYAYISLDSRILSKKKKNQTLGKFKNLIGAAKKGAQEGAAKRRRHN